MFGHEKARRNGLPLFRRRFPRFAEQRDNNLREIRRCQYVPSYFSEREDGTPEQVPTANVTPNFLRMLSATIAFGRDFTDADGQPQPPQPQAGAALGTAPLPAIAILSYEYWERRYGGSTAILGHGMWKGGAGGPLIVGVLAPRFELFFPPR